MPNTITKDLGPVSGYAIAVENGYTGTEEEWIAEVLRGTQNAQTATQKAAEAAASERVAAESADDASDSADSANADALKAEGNAVGKQNDVDVVDGPYYHNNAKYYAEQAEASKRAAASSETAAGTAAAAAQEWATGDDDPTAEPGPENNAKYWAEQATASATAAAGSAASGIAALANEAAPFDATKTYSAGKYVLYNSVLHRFTADHAAGAWAGTDATTVKIAPEVGDLQTQLELKNTPQLIDGRYVSNTGIESGNSGFAVSDFILIDDVLRVTAIYSGVSPSYCVCYFDADKTFVSYQGVSSGGAQVVKLDPPPGAVYVRFNNYKASLSSDNVYIVYQFNAQLYKYYAEEQVRKSTRVEAVSMARGSFVTKEGVIGRNDLFAVTDLINADGVTRIYTRISADYCVVYYDADKEYIGYQNNGITQAITGWYTLEKPAGAKYIRFSTNTQYCPVSDCKIERVLTKAYISEQIEKLSYKGADIAMFTDIGVCGDSYTRCDIYIGNSGVQSYGSSWGKVIERMKGIEVAVYAKGGATVKTFLTDPLCLPKLLDESPKQLYVLCLGINDYATTLGTVDDIKEDYTENPDSFYGNYGRLIDQIKAHAPNAKLIICRTFSVSTVAYTHTADAISEIAEHYSIPMLDPADSSYLTSETYRLNRYNSHPNAAAQSGIANAMCELIGKVIDSNTEYFADFYLPDNI